MITLYGYGRIFPAGIGETRVLRVLLYLAEKAGKLIPNAVQGGER